MESSLLKLHRNPQVLHSSTKYLSNCSRHMAAHVAVLLCAIITLCRAADYSIDCGGIQSGYVGSNYSANSVSLEFVNTAVQNVLFTNCDSDFDTTLYLYDDSGYEIQEQSTNSCGGDDCWDRSYYCSSFLHETFTMASLSTGKYELVLAPFAYTFGNYSGISGGYWEVEVHCNNDTVYAGSSCDSHDDCYRSDANLFCDDSSSCQYCSDCHYCSNGIDGTCGGYCGWGYPLLESDCSDSEESSSSPVTFEEIVYIVFGILGSGCLLFRCKKCVADTPESTDEENLNEQLESANTTTTASTASDPAPVVTQQSEAPVQPVMQPSAGSS